MRAQQIAAVVAGLDAARVRYLIVGGLAVVAHGYVRATQDLDLVVALDPDNARRAAETFTRLGYRPAAPVALELFAREECRAAWRREKGAVVLPLYHAQDPTAHVDLFLSEPFDFARADAAALRLEVARGTVAMFVGLDDLLTMKRAAGRPQGLADVAELETLHKHAVP
jgi:hypothetical protein